MKSLIIISLSTALAVQAAIVSTNAQCGRSNGMTCLRSRWGSCCSQHGWCGSSSAYCATGCQSGFGSCSGTSSPSPAPVSKNARCGAKFGGQTCQGSRYGDCCSQYIYCGSSHDYCGPQSCQKGYGKCDGEPAKESTSTASSVRSSSSVSTSTVSASSVTSLASSTIISSTTSSSLVVSRTSSSQSSTISSSASSSSSSTSSDAPSSTSTSTTSSLTSSSSGPLSTTSTASSTSASPTCNSREVNIQVSHAGACSNICTSITIITGSCETVSFDCGTSTCTYRLFDGPCPSASRSSIVACSSSTSASSSSTLTSVTASSSVSSTSSVASSSSTESSLSLSPTVTPTPTPTPTPRPFICDLAGFPSRSGGPVAYKVFSTSDVQLCGQTCLAEAQCTYVILTNGRCYLSNTPVDRSAPVTPNSSWKFSERACF